MIVVQGPAKVKGTDAHWTYVLGDTMRLGDMPHLGLSGQAVKEAAEEQVRLFDAVFWYELRKLQAGGRIEPLDPPTEKD